MANLSWREHEWDRITVAPRVEIAYTERGSGPPVVFVAGWTMSGEVFEHQLAGLASRFRVIAFDPRSHGRSTVTATGNTYAQHGRDLTALMDELGLARAHLVGWSYGALACYEAIGRAGSSRAMSLTVLDQTPKPLGTGAAGEWAEGDLNEFLDNLVVPIITDRTAFAADFAAWLLDRAPDPEVGQWLAGMHLKTPLNAAEALLVSAMVSDHSALAGSPGVPLANVLTQDNLGPARRWLSAHAPDSTVWTMSSHLAFWDRPAEFNERLVAFLTDGR
jgi:pimeloyl-ACP methyl ester carboxylesterase